MVVPTKPDYSVTQSFVSKRYSIQGKKKIVSMLNTSLHLPRRLDALDVGEADQSPGRQQRQSHLPVKATKVVDTAGNVEGLAVPEVSSGCAPLTFWLRYFGGREAVKRVICKDAF